MKTLLCALVSCLLAAPRAARAETPDALAIEAYVRGEMAAIGVPGCALALVHGDDVVFASGIGVADVRTGERVTARTPFLIASNTKSFTALAVAQLAEDDLLDLDDPVQRHLPEFTLADEGGAAPITLRHLLNHTSGLSRQVGLVGMYDDLNPAGHVAALAHTRPERAAGERYEYSNANYRVLDAVIERVSGVTYAEHLQARVFAPLDMVDGRASEAQARQAGLSAGHRLWFGEPRAELLPIISEPVLALSARDHAHALILHTNSGVYGGLRVVSEASLGALHTPPQGSKYAMGWKQSEVDGVPILRHSGAAANFRAEMFLVPERRLGGALLCNAYHHLTHEDYLRIARGFASMALGGGAPQVEEPGFQERLQGIVLVASIPLLGSLLKLLWTPWWRRRMTRRVSAGEGWFKLLLLPILGELALLVGVLWALPIAIGTPLAVLIDFVPDLSRLIIAALVLDTVILGVRTVLSWRALQPMGRTAE